MSVRFHPTPKKIGPYDAHKASASRPSLGQASSEGKVWKRSRANLIKNPRPSEKKERQEKARGLIARFQGSQPGGQGETK